MAFGVRVFKGDDLEDFSLQGRDCFTLGGSVTDDCVAVLPAEAGFQFQEEYLSFNRVNGVWYAKSKAADVLAAEKKLEDGDCFVVDTAYRIAVFVYEEKVDDTSQFSFRWREKILVGRSADCDIVLADPRVSGHQLQIYKSVGVWGVANESRTNPTFLNHRLLGEGGFRLSEGDVISFSRYNLVFHEEEQIIVVRKMVDVTSEERQPDYPYWYEPAPRLIKKLHTEDVVIDPVPPSMRAMKFNFFQFATTAAMGAMMMSPMMLFSLTSQVGNNEIHKKEAKEYEELRQKKYGEYLDKKEREINDLKIEQRSRMIERDPGLYRIQEILNRCESGLWDRRHRDDDFMNLRVGAGEGDTSFKINGPRDAFTMVEDELEERAKSIAKAGKRISDIPVTCDLMKHKLVGIVGQRSRVKTLAKNMILQAAAHHSYEDLKIVMVYDRKEEADFSWVRWLPHCFSDGRDVRFISSCRADACALFAALKDTFEKRLKEAEKDNSHTGHGVFAPHFLFIISQIELAKNQEILNILQKQDDKIDLGASVIFLYEKMSQLPAECSMIIKADNSDPMMLDKNNYDEALVFTADRSLEDGYEQMARKMAPLRLALRKDEAALPSCITFLEGYHVRHAEEIDIASRWSSTRPHKSLAVPIGVNSDGEAFCFDIHEKFHGVHGLIAGTTGSGKSEMVQSWILSMALHFPPEEVSFVLIDFKGTGLIRPFRDLPHLAGTISNLDNKIHRNLIALRHELVRRQELLDSCKTRTGVEVNDIRDYLELYKGGRITEPMPYLIIVIDEFAEFKVQFPDFMAEVESVFKIGRALGVFAILLTQAPGGVVTAQMDKNMRFRWCLKVGSPADSNEVMHHPDAARISVPGRAYVRVGNDEVYELIQSYYSGAKYRPWEEKNSNDDQDVRIVLENGRRLLFRKPEEKKEKISTDQTQLNAVVKCLDAFVKDNQIARAAQVWLPKLPFRLPLEACVGSNYADGVWKEHDGKHVAPIIGMVDDPARQMQYPLKLDFAENGHYAVFGAPSTGKTTLLQTALMSLVTTYTPEEVNIYIMDFGGWNLGLFKDYPHVGGVANDNDPEKIEKTVSLIEKKLAKRRESFSAAGAGSLEVYEQITGEKLPVIVLVLDNFAPVLQRYPKLDQFFISLTQQGGNYGIYLLVTATAQININFRISQNIKMVLALNMPDRSDYTTLVGRTDGLEPENSEGRGLVKGKPVVEFQTALPSGEEGGAETVRRIQALGAEMKESYKGQIASPLPIMPDELLYSDLERGAVGLSSQEVESVIIPESMSHYYAVIGEPGSGKSNMLLMLAAVYSGRGVSRMAYLDPRKKVVKAGAIDGLEFIESVEDIDAYFERLAPELNERKGKHDLDPTVSFDEICILIDDFSYLYEQMDNKTARRISAIQQLGSGLNVKLVIADGREEFIRHLNQCEGITVAMSTAGYIIMLGGNLMDYDLFARKVPPLERNRKAGVHEGFVQNNEGTLQFRAALYK
ncbi:MAG: type VII secretion protein EssC [Lachnospiraceae bacterium]|nr:type VII secretion protein EssC [Lachnospiraceae bacterium]